jgi:hypothetical protein
MRHAGHDETERAMDDVVELFGMIAIGAALAAPLLYGLSTLLGMTHKQFRPILHRNRPDGATTPVLHGQAEPSIDEHASRTQQGRT